MAELEVAKHGKNVIHLMAKQEHTVSHRIREIGIEIAIIVFAVSDTLTNMQADYRKFDANYAYLSSLEPGKEPDWKKFDAAYQYMDANWYFFPNKSRFDGFMMSGKLNNIEDAAILNRILNLYQSLLPQIRASEGGWATRLLRWMTATQQHYERYQQYIEGSREIIKAIDEAYPAQAGKKG